jgi:hypothetical protein
MGLPLCIVEMNLEKLTLPEKILCPKAHTHIGTLLILGKKRQSDYPVIIRLNGIIHPVSYILPHLTPFLMQGKVPKKIGKS